LSLSNFFNECQRHDQDRESGVSREMMEHGAEAILWQASGVPDATSLGRLRKIRRKPTPAPISARDRNLITSLNTSVRKNFSKRPHLWGI